MSALRLVVVVAILAAAAAMLSGAAPVTCDTDTDCMEKHGGNGDPS